MRNILCFAFMLISSSTFSQKKILDHPDFDIWNKIVNQEISSEGNFIMYSIEKGEKDQHIIIKDNEGNLILDNERSEDGKFTYDSKFAVFKIKAWKDSITEMKRKNVEKEKLPRDSIGLFNLENNSLHKIANVKSYKLPKKWSGFLAYTYDKTPLEQNNKLKDSINSEKGYPLIIRNLKTNKEDTIPFVTNYTFAKEGMVLSYSTSGLKDSINPGVYINNLKTNSSKQIHISHDKTKYFKLNLSNSGDKLAFVRDADSTKTYQRPYELYLWDSSQKNSKLILDMDSSPDGYKVSPYGDIKFSKNESKLYFGLGLPEIVQDTLLLDEEIVNVEVWTYDEPRLYTVQEKQIENDMKKSFQTVYHIKDDKLIQIATKEFPIATLSDEGDGDYALISNPEPYQLSSQWTALFSMNDLAVMNINNGNSKIVIKSNPSTARFSPEGEYAFGYNQVDSTWYTYNIKTSKYTELTKGKVFYDELNDSPDYPRSYGLAGWTKNDRKILIYDRYDIWEFNPDDATSRRLTKGRETKTSFRYVKLDPEKRHIEDSRKMLMTTFNEMTKNSGYFEYNYRNKTGKQLKDGPFRYSIPLKARLTDNVIFSRQSFEEYPNIRISDLNFKSEKVISDVNPQQKDYNWGTAELINWTSLDGLPLTGMLIKPENFDPDKKYPMIVNFYEKSSNGLHYHRAPSPGRSSINYSFYTSRGYLIFNPDVYYKVGYPGESAFNSVIPGVTSLIEKGFVDECNIGVQGHSWGGYQIAYLVTKTDIFKAAESGAPVVNMISAYGGIRWDTGLSRQFQYEHTQSRIGGTPWEYPQRYFENSPIYNIDKINTPLLIMHNDADGHVPWYQGIEFFISLRRLGKPSWLLNYNGARHWPLKIQNRKDFNIRMQQFFDHYLKGEAEPVWMNRGVPAIEKGINQGYELID